MARTLIWLRRALALAAVLVLFLFAVFAVDQNEVSLKFMAWRTPSLSVFWWLLLAFVLGLCLGLAAAARVAARGSMRNRRARKELLAAQEELQQLRDSASAPGPQSYDD